MAGKAFYLRRGILSTELVAFCEPFMDDVDASGKTRTGEPYRCPWKVA